MDDCIGERLTELRGPPCGRVEFELMLTPKEKSIPAEIRTHTRIEPSFESLMLCHGPDESQRERPLKLILFYEIKGSKLHLNVRSVQRKKATV